MVTIRAGRVLLDGAFTGPAQLAVEGGRIASVTVGDALAGAPAADVDLGAATLTPGLLDLQINGSFGADFADATPEQWTRVLGGLAARGVTAVQPTIITAPLAQLGGAFARVRQARDENAGGPAARVLGAHLEGPFISPSRKGTHRPDWMVEPSPEHLDVLLAHPATREVLTTLTLAPELPHALDATRRLVAEGVVAAVGHSDATAAQVHAAADAGATMTTHVFNAQRPLGHREPGVPGAVLTDERFYVGTIVDGQHLDPSVVRLVYTAAAGRAIAVTDAIVTAGLPNHTWLQFGGRPVANDDTGLGRREDGTITGAGIVLDEGVRRMVASGLDAATVLASCTEVAARSLGRADLGRLAVGAHADLVAWDSSWHPVRVWVGGSEIAASVGTDAVSGWTTSAGASTIRA